MRKERTTMKKTLLLFVVCLVLTAGCYYAVSAAGGYDSTTDPVITLSYVNNNLLPQINSRISELEKLIESGGGSSGDTSVDLSALTERISSIEKSISSLGGRVPAEGAVYAADFTAIFVPYGQTIQAPTSALELILRSGSAVAVSPFSDQGLSDITGGSDLLNGVVITANHLLIIPRGADGRGMRITSAEGAYVMVRGEYRIVN